MASQADTINKAQKVIEKLNDENKQLVEQWDTLCQKLDGTDSVKAEYSQLKVKHKEAQAEIEKCKTQINIFKE